MCQGAEYTEIDPYEAAADILRDKPESLWANDFIDRLYEEMEEQPETFTFVQLADFHTDLWYQEGAIADCSGRYCCRNDSVNGSTPAGKFGAPGAACDIPPITVQSTLDFVRDHIKPDAVFWTGDNSPHDRVTGDRAIYETALSTNFTADLIQKALSPNITYAVIGNHDIYPHWDFGAHKGNPAAASSAPHWRAWLNNESEYQQFLATGYFSTDLRLPTNYPVKVIGLNTETCDVENHFVYGQLSDPMGQLNFLLAELRALEQRKGLAILISHITPDDGCNHEYAVRLRAILERY